MSQYDFDQTNLVAHWGFEEQVGTIAYDTQTIQTSSNMHQATFTGSVSWSTDNFQIGDVSTSVYATSDGNTAVTVYCPVGTYMIEIIIGSVNSAVMLHSITCSDYSQATFPTSMYASTTSNWLRCSSGFRTITIMRSGASGAAVTSIGASCLDGTSSTVTFSSTSYSYTGTCPSTAMAIRTMTVQIGSSSGSNFLQNLNSVGCVPNVDYLAQTPVVPFWTTGGTFIRSFFCSPGSFITTISTCISGNYVAICYITCNSGERVYPSSPTTMTSTCSSCSNSKLLYCRNGFRTINVAWLSSTNTISGISVTCPDGSSGGSASSGSVTTTYTATCPSGELVQTLIMRASSIVEVFKSIGCTTPVSLPDFSTDYVFSSGGNPSQATWNCYATPEMCNSAGTWQDNVFCYRANKLNPRYQWAWAGAISNMNCIYVQEPLMPSDRCWGDNYICFPIDTPYRLVWSSNGAVDAGDCVQWAESSDQYFQNNFLCEIRAYPYSLTSFLTYGISASAGTLSTANGIAVMPGTLFAISFSERVRLSVSAHTQWYCGTNYHLVFGLYINGYDIKSAQSIKGDRFYYNLKTTWFVELGAGSYNFQIRYRSPCTDPIVSAYGALIRVSVLGPGSTPRNYTLVTTADTLWNGYVNCRSRNLDVATPWDPLEWTAATTYMVSTASTQNTYLGIWRPDTNAGQGGFYWTDGTPVGIGPMNWGSNEGLSSNEQPVVMFTPSTGTWNLADYLQGYTAFQVLCSRASYSAIYAPMNTYQTGWSASTYTVWPGLDIKRTLTSRYVWVAYTVATHNYYVITRLMVDGVAQMLAQSIMDDYYISNFVQHVVDAGSTGVHQFQVFGKGGARDLYPYSDWQGYYLVVSELPSHTILVNKFDTTATSLSSSGAWMPVPGLDYTHTVTAARSHLFVTYRVNPSSNPSGVLVEYQLYMNTVAVTGSYCAEATTYPACEYTYAVGLSAGSYRFQVYVKTWLGGLTVTHANDYMVKMIQVAEIPTRYYVTIAPASTIYNTVLVVLVGGDTLTFSSGSSSQTFTCTVAFNQEYVVYVSPASSSNHTCTLGSGSTGVASSNINIVLTCTAVPSVQVTSGMPSSSVTASWGANSVTITERNVPYFYPVVNIGTSYSITATTAASGVTCATLSGTVTSAYPISLICSSTLSATVATPLTGTLVLTIGGVSTSITQSSVSYTLTSSAQLSASYSVTVTSPSGMDCGGPYTGTMGTGPTSFTVTCAIFISAQVSGLTAGSVTLLVNGGSALVFNAPASSALQFSTAVTYNTAFVVTVSSPQPTDYSCVPMTSGTATAATTVPVVCSYYLSIQLSTTPTSSVTFVVSGVQSVTATSTVAVKTPITYRNGQLYSITVSTQPAGWSFSSTSAFGTVTQPTTVTFTPKFFVGVTVSGIGSTSLSGYLVVVDSANTAETLSTRTNGVTYFTTSWSTSATVHTVSISSTPTNHNCSIASASVTISNAPATVTVSCGFLAFINVAGLSTRTATFSLTSGGSSVTMTVTGDGKRSFNRLLTPGTAYTLAVTAQPSSGTTCTLASTSGTATGPFTVVATCETNAQAVGDPVITGFGNQKFDFSATPGRVYNWYSDADIQVNVMLAKPNRKSGIYATKLGVRLGKHIKLSLQVWPEYLLRVTPLEEVVDEEGTMRYRLGNCGNVTFSGEHNMHIIWNKFLIKVTPRGHLDGTKLLFNYFNLEMTSKSHTEKVHGVLGRTLLLPRNLVGHGMVGEGVLEGTEDDYVVQDGLLGTDSITVAFDWAEPDESLCGSELSEESEGAAAHTASAAHPDK